MKSPTIHHRKVCQLRIDWLQQAALLPGKGLHVGLLLMVSANYAQSPSVLLTPYPLRRFGVSRDASYAALGRLDNAGLIQVRRTRGSMPRGPLLDPDDQQPLAAD